MRLPLKILLSIIVIAAIVSGYLFLAQKTQHKKAASVTATHSPINATSEGLSADYSTPPAICTVPLVADIVAGVKGEPHWNTANGQYPDGLSEMQVHTGGYGIVTPINFKSISVLRDKRTSPTKEFDLSGGKVGLDSMKIESTPDIVENQRYIGIFLPTYDPASKRYSQRLLNLLQVLRVNSQGLIIMKPKTIEQGQVSQQEQTMSLEALQSELHSCKN